MLERRLNQSVNPGFSRLRDELSYSVSMKSGFAESMMLRFIIRHLRLYVYLEI